ncbi:hypothetical protein JCM8547_008476 [Rhodosporidiobolus lusitaniae]
MKRPSDSPLSSPSKRPLTAHLSSTKPALSPSHTCNSKSTATSTEMSRSGSQKENCHIAPLVFETTSRATVDLCQDENVSMDDRSPAEESAPTPAPESDPLFDVSPTSSPSRAIPHIYAHASLLLSTSSSLSSSLSLEGRADQRETLLAFLSRRFPSAYAPLASEASSSKAPGTPTRPGPASMYVSGPPGIGKTALLNVVVDELKANIGERELGEEVKVHMENCATIGAGGAEGAWERLAKGLRLKVEEGMEKMKGREKFEMGIKDGRKYLLILDEIDHLVAPSSASSRSTTSSSAPDLLNSLFALASTPASPLTLIGIANDLTLKALSLTPTTTPTKSAGKGTAKLDPLHTPTKPVRLHFKPYLWQELAAIVGQRLALLAPSYPYLPPSSPSELPTPPATPASSAAKGKPTYPLLLTPALDRLTKKIASTSGDVRTVLSLVRQTISLSLPSSSNSASLSLLTPSTAPKATMAHLSVALLAATASNPSSGLSPAPTLAQRLTALQAGPHHRLVLVSILLAISRVLPAGLDSTAAEGAGRRVTVDDAFKVYRETVIPSAEALKATKLDAGAFAETVGMVEDLCGAVLVRGRAGGAGSSPSKGKGSGRTKASERGRVTVELSPSAPLPELVDALSRPPKEGEENKEGEPERFARRAVERERSEQRWRIKRVRLGRDEERRAEEELEGREWERRVLAREMEGQQAKE